MKFLISVIDDHSGSGTPEEMSAIKAFNDGLREKGYLVLAEGLIDSATAVVIDNRAGANIVTDGPLFTGKENISGFGFGWQKGMRAWISLSFSSET